MIKKLDKNNWQKWKEIRLEALEKAPDSFLSSFAEERNTPDNSWISQATNGIKFGYFIDGEIVGCCSLSLEKSAKISHTATLSQMYVKNDFRGKGIALALVNFVKNCAQENNVKHLYLGCNAQNLSAVLLYKKCGFKVYGTRPDYTKIGSKFYDDLIMMCEL